MSVGAGLPEKPPLQATRKGGKWRVVHALAISHRSTWLRKKWRKRRKINDGKVLDGCRGPGVTVERRKHKQIEVEKIQGGQADVRDKPLAHHHRNPAHPRRTNGSGHHQRKNITELEQLWDELKTIKAKLDMKEPEAGIRLSLGSDAEIDESNRSNCRGQCDRYDHRCIGGGKGEIVKHNIEV